MLNYKTMAEGARSFYNFGMQRREQLPIGFSIVPHFVNMAFACELYMKALLLFEKPNMTVQELKKLGHRLDNLFEALSSSIKDEVKKQFTDQTIQEYQKRKVSSCQDILSSNAPDDVKDVASHYLQQNVSSFDDILKNNASIFEDWRYFYEAVDGCYISCDEGFISSFATVLHNIMVGIMNQT